MGTCTIPGCGDKAVSRTWCVKHYTRWQRHGDPEAITRTPPTTAGASEKRCPRCTKIKPIEMFGKRPNGKPKGYCSACEAAYLKSYAATEDAKASHRIATAKWTNANRDYLLRYKYGIGEADYDRMLTEQSGRCAICGTENPGSKIGVFCVDHCHNTDKVRGLLCTHCNMAIGQMLDSPARLRAAADYLEKHQP